MNKMSLRNKKNGLGNWWVSALAPASLLLFSCAAVGPDYTGPGEVDLPTNYRFQSTANGKPIAKRANWWRSYKDPGLNRLLQQVADNNHSLRAGLKRVEQARTMIQLARSQGLPQVGIGSSVDRSGTSQYSQMGKSIHNTFNTPLNAGWEIDLFGRIRRQVEAAQADSEASEEALNDLHLSLETEAAAGWFNLRALDWEIDLVKEGVNSRQGSLRLAEDRHALGITSSLDVSQAKTLLATSEADLEGLKRQRNAQEAALAVLAGQPATNFRLAHNPLKSSAPSVPAGLPSELLRARPDIRRAERRLAAENARIGVAVAAFYPSISLNGNLGMQASDFAHMIKRGAHFWSIGPEVYLPLFQGSARRAQLAAQKARYEEVLEDYQQTILEALAEVETRLSASGLYSTQLKAQRRAIEAAHEARDTALDQYNGGTADYLNVLDAERTALDAERQEALLFGAEYANSVNLIRALGGHWEGTRK